MADTKVAIVTGGSKGFGAAISKRLARDGFTVIVNYSGDAGAAQDVVDEIGRAGGAAVPVKADVGDAAAVTALVSNAGIMKLAPLVETDESLFDSHVAVNLKGVFLGLKEAGRRMASGSVPTAAG